MISQIADYGPPSLDILRESTPRGFVEYRVVPKSRREIEAERRADEYATVGGLSALAVFGLKSMTQPHFDPNVDLPIMAALGVIAAAVGYVIGYRNNG